jgi:hypothetical protein
VGGVAEERSLTGLEKGLALAAALLTLLSAFFGFQTARLQKEVNKPPTTTIVTVPPRTEARTVTITSPEKDEVVPYAFAIRGRASGLRPGEVVWIFDREEGSNRYYPNNLPCPIGKDGSTWYCPSKKVGIKQDNKRYELIAAILDGNAQQAVLNWQYDGIDKGDFPGLDGLPEGTFYLKRALADESP